MHSRTNLHPHTYPVLTMASKQVLTRITRNKLMKKAKAHNAFCSTVGASTGALWTISILITTSDSNSSYLCRRCPHGSMWAPILDVWMSWRYTMTDQHGLLYTEVQTRNNAKRMCPVMPLPPYTQDSSAVTRSQHTAKQTVILCECVCV